MIKIFLIIFIFSFVNFSFVNAENLGKICSKDSKTVENLYWKEIIFEYHEINSFEEKSYSIPKDYKYLFYKDSWYVCLEGKILYLKNDPEVWDLISTEKWYEKILEKDFDYISYKRPENIIKYKDKIYIWILQEFENADYYFKKFWFFDINDLDASEDYKNTDSVNLDSLNKSEIGLNNQDHPYENSKKVEENENTTQEIKLDSQNYPYENSERVEGNREITQEIDENKNLFFSIIIVFVLLITILEIKNRKKEKEYIKNNYL